MAVSGKKLAAKAVTSAKLAPNAVTGAKTTDGTLLAVDLGAGQLSAGPKGPRGKGDPGLSGLSGYERVTGAWAPIASGGQVTVFAICPSGKRSLGGGTETSPIIDVDIIYSGTFSDSSWAVRVAGDGNYGPGNVRVWAVCAYAG